MVGITLGIESTAHTAAVGIISPDGTILADEKSIYTPEKGSGIHPREAGRHHAEALPKLITDALLSANLSSSDISLVSFARGPGLGPCLRTGATAARSFGHKLNIPIIGVNHCVAHLEIGLLEGATDPVLLYVSGANTQVIAYSNGRFRVFGETLDIGLGNGLDKFGREVGLEFPGGPKIEKLSEGPNLINLPYSVKGMDMSFSGLITSSLNKFKSGQKLENVCYSLQETAFAMSCEVAERALAHTGKNELVLGGGVACNSRLREMAETMAKERNATCFVPERSLCVDNGVMIAWLGSVMMAGDYQLSEIDNQVDQKFRTDMVEVSWR
ncbi:MAG: UGMP family protein [Marine Group III euryarchaeote CG-Bathy1]|uniref:tRNA N6-adenosine threonylcarbamoyltransferase n=1 Tax=Marine Group III euryarchaeote CG-Bathy1 TaxID=1889001 RepID=A0A1J5TVW3_9ARCH|nr:MAG: UGMP family protein [Marine Group III euryarchaeote CG-Bathy1]